MEKDRREPQELEQMKIEPFTLLHDILMNWWVILLGAAAAAMLTYVAVNMRYVPRYTTSTTFVVASKGNSNAVSNLSSANSMAKTFESILKSNVMKKTLCEKLGVKEIDAEINTQVLEGTNLLVLSVTENSPKEAIDLIRAIMDNYSSVSFYTLGNAVMDVLEEPKVPMSADNPLNARGAVKKGFLAAAAFLIALFGLLSYLKDTVKREDDIEEKLDARNLGVISYERKNKTLRECLQRKKGALLINKPLAGFAFQRRLEQAAFHTGGGDYRAPVQTVGDLLAGRATTALGEVQPSYRPGVTPADLRAVLPPFVTEAICAALPLFGRQLAGFDRPDAVLTGVESRSSSPVRLPRGEDGQSAVEGLFPCGEGAGYAGGILSAAVDGIRCAEGVLALLK